ncbi:hypothetical protein pipiens_019183 [Culex pipiens pipiens]|uniref:Uncharacterized protein n=1 Tax=Culex pipiens pipiens TaxID=38569 RepID=A0ABD1DY81_CULPP
MRCLRKKMSQVFSLTHRYKRTLQAMAAGTFLIYMTLVLYQNVYGYNGGNTVQLASGSRLDDDFLRFWAHEIGPRSGPKRINALDLCP